MSFLSFWFISGIIILALIVLLWLLNLQLKNASIIDIFWGLGFVIIFWATYLFAETTSARSILLGILVTIWGLRLSIHIYQRNHNKPEDFRYAKWREENGTNWWW